MPQKQNLYQEFKTNFNEYIFRLEVGLVKPIEAANLSLAFIPLILQFI